MGPLLTRYDYDDVAGAYEASKIKLAEAAPSLSPSATQIAAGFIAECCAVVLWNPWEVVRQRMQLETLPKSFIATTEDVRRWDANPRDPLHWAPSLRGGHVRIPLVLSVPRRLGMG